MKEDNTPVISAESRKILEKEFSVLQGPVPILVFTDDGQNRQFNEFTISLMEEFAGISAWIRPDFKDIGSNLARDHHVTRSPTLLVSPGKYHIRFTGAPSGEEARTLIMTILMASSGRTILSDESRQRLEDLRERRSVRVFVSPTCPYCPQQAVLAIAAAIEKSDLISAEIVEIYENRDLATQYDAFSVPQVFIDDHLVGMGLQPEEAFIEEILSAAPARTTVPVSDRNVQKDLVVIGAGPAGLTAAIYAERSGLRSVVIEKANIGGQVSVTPVVENYPGFTKIAGKTLMDMMAQQAIHYAEIHEGEEVLSIEREGEKFAVTTSRTIYSAAAVLITTGAESRKLGVPGESDFQGRGVSYCAACDGFFFKDEKKVLVVGGGNTAVTEALYLKNLGANITLVHRRDSLRAEMALQKKLFDSHIPVMFNSEVKEIRGDRVVHTAVIENTLDRSVQNLPVDGVFIAVGYAPKNDLALKLGVAVDGEGYIKVDSGNRTNVKGIYAAGDITGGVKQIVTAVGQGAVAAMKIFEDLVNPYWKERS